MKNLFLTSILVISALLSVNAQEFEGEITFKITYTDLPAEAEMMKAMLPTKLLVFMKNEKSSTEQTVMGMIETKNISNTKTKKTFALINMMGNKTYTESNIETGDVTNEFEVIKKTETKNIAGYKSNKAILKTKDGVEMVYWYTNELPGYQGQNIPNVGLDGFPMEFEINQQGMKIKMSVTSVEKKTVSDSVFEIPADYVKKTEEEMKKMIKGMMGGM